MSFHPFLQTLADLKTEKAVPEHSTFRSQTRGVQLRRCPNSLGMCLWGRSTRKYLRGQGSDGPEINSDGSGYNTDFPPAGKSGEEPPGTLVVTVGSRVDRPSEAGGDTTRTTNVLPDYRQRNAFVMAQVLARLARLIGL